MCVFSMKKENGFTLVELIVAIFIGSLVLTAIYSFINMAQRSSSGIERRVGAQQDARGALELMAMELRMASYNPLSQRPWAVPASCSGLSADQIYRGIQEATANSITIEMDLNGNGVVEGTTGLNPDEVIKYVYDSSNKEITRSTSCATPQPFLGAANSNTDQKTVSVENNAAGIPVFRYFNASGTDITSTVVLLPTDLDRGIPGIRRIQITLVVDTWSKDIGSTTPRRIIYSTSVIPRNHFALLYR